LSTAQEVSSVHAIDSLISSIDKDPTLVKKVQDSASYQKEDGGEIWDSLYNHREIYYKDGQVVKIRAWNSYGNWRSDMLAYYIDDKAIRFSKGESFKEQPNYRQLDFQIYYYQDKDIQVTWLTPKPDNVLGVATDVFLQWAYSLLKKTR
jgi:hypothetical protein